MQKFRMLWIFYVTSSCHRIRKWEISDSDLLGAKGRETWHLNAWKATNGICWMSLRVNKLWRWLIPILNLPKCPGGWSKGENGDLRSPLASPHRTGKQIKTKFICHNEGKRVSIFSIRDIVENVHFGFVIEKWKKKICAKLLHSD